MNLLEYRIKYGQCFVSVFDELIIPWRKLTLQEWLNFNRSSTSAFIVAEVEDIIFDLCVLDKTIKENSDLLPAGIISAVANQVLTSSGPNTEIQINNALQESRNRMDSFFHSLLPYICSVFPAYKPEDLLSLDVETLMDRVALAEKRLIQLKLIPEEGFAIEGYEQEDSRQAQPEPVRSKPEPAQSRSEKISNKLGNLSSGTVIAANEMASTFVQDGATGHELSDKSLWQADVLNGLENIYPEYFKLISEGKKITADVIKSVKGTTPEEIKNKHKEYVDKLKSGEIVPSPPKFLIADKMEGQTKTGKRKRAVITRLTK